MVQAKANARSHHLEIEGLLRDFSNLEVAQSSFDVIWFRMTLYSYIPIRAVWISVLQGMHRAFRHGAAVCASSIGTLPAVLIPSGDNGWVPGWPFRSLAISGLKRRTNCTRVLISSILSVAKTHCALRSA